MLKFTKCYCEDLAVTLAGAKLQPTTSMNPRFCFAFDLLDWAEALILEGQVCLQYYEIEIICISV